MFNRALTLKIVKTKPVNTDKTPNRPLIHSDDAAELATTVAYWTKRAALGASFMYAGKKVVDTSAEIALIIAKSKFN